MADVGHIAAALWAMSLAAAVAATPGPTSAWRMAALPTCAGFTASDETRIAHGAITVRSLPGASRNETVVTGGIRIRVSPEAYVAAFRDIVRFKRSPLVLQVGTLASPATPDDVAGLTIDASDIDAMRRCHTGDCDIKLAVETITRLRTDIAWDTPDAAAQAERLMKDALVEYVEAYRAGGDRALGDYADQDDPVRIADEFGALLDGSPCVTALPALATYFREYPRARLDDADDFFYWSKESFGMKAIVSLTHAVIYRPTPGLILIASKAIYSSHYIEASLGLGIIVDVSTSTTPMMDLIYINRSRADGLRSWLAPLARGPIARRQRDAVARELRLLRNRLER